ncbi:putative cut9 interacting protein [Erysiphe necator]|uniref:Putative cut9 interacting protein n=1 Tax=Uncinula necator TaxID=52586 RepID=A0A0B1P7M3_UNCNE|nr:putative cut9 interacting protein [Erysiphe necator]
MKARCLTVMATREQDQRLVFQLATSFGVNCPADLGDETPTRRVIPSFGWHPWFSHVIYDDTNLQSMNPSQEKDFKINHYKSILIPIPEDIKFIESLPNPRSLKNFLEEIKNYLKIFPTALIGEIGLDKNFRIPIQWNDNKNIIINNINITPGTRNGRQLSKYRVNMNHQKIIFRAQLQLAGEMNRSVSIHSVQAHGAVFDTLQDLWKEYKIQNSTHKKTSIIQSKNLEIETIDTKLSRPFPRRICLHAYSGSIDLLKQYLDPKVPAIIYFSFCALLNLPTDKVTEVIKAVPEDRILVESDFDKVTDDMDQLLEKMCRRICNDKNWPLEKGVEILGNNWRQFIF